MKSILILCLTILVSQLSYAQFFGKTIKAHNLHSIPFVHYTIDDSIHGVSNFDGIFEIKQEFTKITFFHPLYNNVQIPSSYFIHQDTTPILFIPQKKLDFITKSNEGGKAIIRKVIENRQENHPNKHAPYYYETYNKFSIETDQICETKSLVDKYLQKLKLLKDKKITDYELEHHLVISESTSRTRYLSPLYEDEFITSSKVSGVETPLLVTANSKLQSIHLYDKFVRIGSKNYVNPIQHGTFLRYNFEVLDSVISHTDTLFLVSFFPKKKAKFEALKGLLYISSKQYAVEYAIINPLIEHSTQTTYLIESEWIEDKKCWFPKRSYVEIQTNEFTLENIKLTTISHSLIHHVVLDTTFSKNDFTEIYMDYDTISHSHDYWEKERKLLLSIKDKNTYTFYDSVGSLHNLDRLINLGERLKMKQIPYKYLYINLLDVLRYNHYEGFRVGLGLKTNPKFSKTIQLVGHVGYGLKDKALKYGFATKFFLKTRLPSFFYAHYQNDVQESGKALFSYDKPQFSSEWLRDLKVYQMDFEQKIGGGIQIQPHKYIYLLGEMNTFLKTPLYNYQFKNDSVETYQYNSFKLGIKYAFGEQFFRLLHEKISIGSLYPSFWINYEQGINSFTFYKINSKLEYQHHFVNGGISTIQLIGGFMKGDVPYFLLFNGKGSQGVRSIAHNSFETMAYNEFLSSDFINVFYSHDFGYWNFFNNQKFRPRLEVAMNGGFGKLTNKTSHQQVNFKTMEKGFFESGFLINNLVTPKIYALKIGLGIGYYLRFGAYATQNLKQDSYVKISINFSL